MYFTARFCSLFNRLELTCTRLFWNDQKRRGKFYFWKSLHTPLQVSLVYLTWSRTHIRTVLTLIRTVLIIFILCTKLTLSCIGVFIIYDVRLQLHHYEIVSRHSRNGIKQRNIVNKERRISLQIITDSGKTSGRARWRP